MRVEILLGRPIVIVLQIFMLGSSGCSLIIIPTPTTIIPYLVVG
jgi:hypothetical protein